jgi:toxin CcdB
LRQFDVYDAPTETSRRIAPFVVVLQSHFLESVPTVIVAPLLRQAERPAYADVSVPIRFADQELVLSLAELATIQRAMLRRSRGTLLEHEDDIRRALERVFTGF